ncbi:hypothetical protein N0V90_001622 [Kalmusia sp. IMI 367209]|nr:hypothetical protein N0V90_001622 [Kalmusia sp. IMI 367209]
MQGPIPAAPGFKSSIFLPPLEFKAPEAPTSSQPTASLTGAPRPTQLFVHYHPHPLKRLNKAHIDILMGSLVPGAPPVATSLHMRARKAWRPWSFRAPFTAEAETEPCVDVSSFGMEKRKKKMNYWNVEANFDALVDEYMRKGYVRAVVRDSEGKGVDCNVVLTREGEAVPEGAFRKISVWREPFVWVVKKILECEERERADKAKREATEKREGAEKAGGDGDDVESITVFDSDEDEKKAMSLV